MLSKTLSKLISRRPPFNDQGGGLADRRPVAWVTGFQPPAWRTASRAGCVAIPPGYFPFDALLNLPRAHLRGWQRAPQVQVPPSQRRLALSPAHVLAAYGPSHPPLPICSAPALGCAAFSHRPAPRSVGTSNSSSNGPICADGTFEHDAWVGMRCRHRLYVRDFLGNAMMEKIAARTPGFERGLHRRHGYREVLKPL